MTWQALSFTHAFRETLRTSGLIYLIVIGALIFSVFVGVTGLTVAAGELVEALGLGTIGTLLVIVVILLLLGLGVSMVWR